MSGDARVAFLTGLIDDAGLFPPASLPMDEAVAAHTESRGGKNGWILARFICPASRLPEVARPGPPREATWPVAEGGTGGRGTGLGSTRAYRGADTCWRARPGAWEWRPGGAGRRSA